MRARLVALFAAILACAVAFADPLTPGRYHRTIEIAGKPRHYILVIPPAYNGVRSLPLVMMLHGYTGNAETSDYYTGLGAKAQRENFILVLADGTGTPQGWNCGWINLGSPGVDDVAFLTQLLDSVEAAAKVDLRREYIVGHSNGAFMTYVMGSKLAGRIAAIGVVAGTVGTDRGARPITVAPPAKPVSAIILHGINDKTVPYNHGAGLLSNVVAAPDSARFWAKANGIDANLKHSQPDAFTEIDDYKGPKAEVELVTFHAGTHEWPGGFTLHGLETASGARATDLIWDFFRAHPLPK
jgi:polyhydroxybutyrate depolymerase